ncbi:UNVERIFIED_CONTAM: hypothetical protein HDU68_000829 [Siphonaria sp. JEL0065]|nr:hypothetical protein HDU68_000829 [Siphonaria sp. JEL0065]
MYLLLTVTYLSLAALQAAAHGMMNFPIMRIQPGDQQNGYTFARAASNRNTGVHASPDISCAYLPKGPVFTQVLASGILQVDYTITAFHNGGCIIYLSKDDQKTWQKIGEDKACGVQAKNPTGRASVTATLPAGNYNAVLRWSYTADNGGSPNEIFNNCADISVSPTGTNKHEKVEFLGAPASGFVALAKSPAKYFDSSCPIAGATLCSQNTAFINKCVSLAAGGGWTGGSSWYAYQCPFGSTCKNVNGVDLCVGGSLPPVPVKTTTKVSPPKTTKKTTKTTTKTTKPAPKPKTTKKSSTTTQAVPKPKTTAKLPATPKPPTETGVPSGGKPCTTAQALVLPIPKGMTCVDVKHACQTFCLNNKMYNVERNQCFGENGVTATQWCQCDGKVYYGVAFGKPTAQCPTK